MQLYTEMSVLSLVYMSKLAPSSLIWSRRMFFQDILGYFPGFYRGTDEAMKEQGSIPGHIGLIIHDGFLRPSNGTVNRGSLYLVSMKSK
jgi:hypothetical protein